ncbi:MAG: PhoH family protein [Bacteroidales bacterium]|jgi:phosphate starvation-inducible PhoH-like protein|nr:PhoH family protein [Bacteroidales bacterium]MED9962700.1 PhoH family protein [Bacteroidales bacterium]MEE0267439.1 PhoH family protein [Bacteroidales bacterium]MEE0882506.1 PhoH family protein [Bacteroidales bacterium]MEE1221753.1 PhoH family protein [Bacteroidales bacterium]
MEQTFDLENIDLREFWGVNNKNFKFLETIFPTLNLIERAGKLAIQGEEKDIKDFTKFFDNLLIVFEKQGYLEEKIIMSVLQENEYFKNKEEEVLVYGDNGLRVKARSENQAKMVKESESNDMLFAIGPAGSGKTYTAVALAVRALKAKIVKRIILTRPAVEAGENLGFLPGDLKEKLDPYLQPLYDALRDMLSQQKLESLIQQGVIEIAPLAFMRGRTLDNAFVILDEAQNTSMEQLKMFLTRMGRNSKFIITGDVTQIDLPKNQISGLLPTIERVQHIKGIAVIELQACDIVRHRLVSKIIEALD